MHAAAKPRRRALEGMKRRIEPLVEGIQIIGPTIREAGLGIRPDAFVRIELGRVGRKKLEVETRVAAAQFANRRALVDRSIVEDGNHVASQMTQHVTEEVAHLGLADVVAVAAEVESHPTADRADRQSRDHRETIVPVVVGNLRGLSAGRPGPPKVRNQEEPRFVDEDEVRLPALGVFFTCGQRVRFQRSMRSSSRSSARRSGFCGLSPS